MPMDKEQFPNVLQSILESTFMYPSLVIMIKWGYDVTGGKNAWLSLALDPSLEPNYASGELDEFITQVKNVVKLLYKRELVVTIYKRCGTH